MRSRTSPISRKEKIATAAATTRERTNPEKSQQQSTRYAEPWRPRAQGVGLRSGARPHHVHSRATDQARVAWGLSSSIRVRQRARIEKRAFRDIAPTQRRAPEFDEAVVYPPRQIILAASLVEHFAGHLAERLQDRVVELANLDRRIVGKLLERNGVIGGKIRI